jgi:hypothetical protein
MRERERQSMWGWYKWYDLVFLLLKTTHTLKGNVTFTASVEHVHSSLAHKGGV